MSRPVTAKGGNIRPLRPYRQGLQTYPIAEESGDRDSTVYIAHWVICFRTVIRDVMWWFL